MSVHAILNSLQWSKVGVDMAKVLRPIWEQHSAEFVPSALVRVVRMCKDASQNEDGESEDTRPGDAAALQQLLDEMSKAALERIHQFDMLGLCSLLRAHGAIGYRHPELWFQVETLVGPKMNQLSPGMVADVALANALVGNRETGLWPLLIERAHGLADSTSAADWAQFLTALAIAGVSDSRKTSWCNCMFDRYGELGGQIPLMAYHAAEASGVVAPPDWETRRKIAPPRTAFSKRLGRKDPEGSLRDFFAVMKLKPQIGRIFQTHPCQFLVTANSLGVGGCERVNFELTPRWSYLLSSDPLAPRGDLVLRDRLLLNHGVRVVRIPRWQWCDVIATKAGKRALFEALLARAG